MKKTIIIFLTFLFTICYAEEKVTIEAKSIDISEQLDLKAVATLFGQVKTLEDFEQQLNNEENHLSNLDLNADGNVDYLRIVESVSSNTHIILIQAVLALDIFQDIATIYVEKTSDESVNVQLVGDTYIYGTNYIIEPVYIYRPIIYSWLWCHAWVCWTSPWYWGYWPGWYAPYPCWGYRDYYVHIHVYHHDHVCCSYRYNTEVRGTAARISNNASRSDYAHSQGASHSFASRTGVNNAHELNKVVSRSNATSNLTSRSMSTSITSRSRTSAPITTSRSTTSYSDNANVTTSRSISTNANTYNTPTRSTTYNSSRGTTLYNSSTSTLRGSNTSYSGNSNSYSGSRSSYSGSNYSGSRSNYSGSNYSGSRSSYSGSSYSGSSYSGSRSSYSTSTNRSTTSSRH